MVSPSQAQRPRTATVFLPGQIRTQLRSLHRRLNAREQLHKAIGSAEELEAFLSIAGSTPANSYYITYPLAKKRTKNSSPSQAQRPRTATLGRASGGIDGRSLSIAGSTPANSYAGEEVDIVAHQTPLSIAGSTPANSYPICRAGPRKPVSSPSQAQRPRTATPRPRPRQRGVGPLSIAGSTPANSYLLLRLSQYHSDSFSPSQAQRPRTATSPLVQSRGPKRPALHRRLNAREQLPLPVTH